METQSLLCDRRRLGECLSGNGRMGCCRQPTRFEKLYGYVLTATRSHRAGSPRRVMIRRCYDGLPSCANQFACSAHGTCVETVTRDCNDALGRGVRAIESSAGWRVRCSIIGNVGGHLSKGCSATALMLKRKSLSCVNQLLALIMRQNTVHLHDSQQCPGCRRERGAFCITRALVVTATVRFAHCDKPILVKPCLNQAPCFFR